MSPTGSHVSEIAQNHAAFIGSSHTPLPLWQLRQIQTQERQQVRSSKSTRTVSKACEQPLTEPQGRVGTTKIRRLTSIMSPQSDMMLVSPIAKI